MFRVLLFKKSNLREQWFENLLDYDQKEQNATDGRTIIV